MRVLHNFADAGLGRTQAIRLLGIGLDRDRRQGLLIDSGSMGDASKSADQSHTERQQARCGKFKSSVLAIFHKQSRFKSD
jgi:hypothetical protein